MTALPSNIRTPIYIKFLPISFRAAVSFTEKEGGNKRRKLIIRLKGLRSHSKEQSTPAKELSGSAEETWDVARYFAHEEYGRAAQNTTTQLLQMKRGVLAGQCKESKVKWKSFITLFAVLPINLKTRPVFHEEAGLVWGI